MGMLVTLLPMFGLRTIRIAVSCYSMLLVHAAVHMQTVIKH